MMRARCSAQLAGKRADSTCSRLAVEGKGGLCTFHFNRLGLIAGGYNEEPDKPESTFECLICCEDKLDSKLNMDLECGDAICRKCFDNLSDPKCPYCRKDMKSAKVGRREVETLHHKATDFKREMEERTFRNFMEDDMAVNDRDGGRNNFLQFLDMVMMENDGEKYTPEFGTEEDILAVTVIVEDMLNNVMPAEDTSLVHTSVHLRFPHYTCEYITEITRRGIETFYDL